LITYIVGTSFGPNKQNPNETSNIRLMHELYLEYHSGKYNMVIVTAPHNGRSQGAVEGLELE